MSTWLDMSQYPEVDPDVALSADESHLLRAMLTEPVPDVPNDVWHRMLDVTWTAVDGEAVGDDADLDDPAAPDDPGSVDEIDSIATDWGESHLAGAFPDDGHLDDAPDDASDDG